MRRTIIVEALSLELVDISPGHGILTRYSFLQVCRKMGCEEESTFASSNKLRRTSALPSVSPSLTAYFIQCSRGVNRPAIRALNQVEFFSFSESLFTTR